MELNTYDTFLLGMLALFAILGLYWGLIRQVLAITGLVVGVALAGQYGSVVAGWLSSFITSPMLANGIGFIVVMMAVSTLASVIASVLRIFVGLLFLGWLDIILGGLLGLIQAIVAGAALTIAMITYPDPLWNSWLAGSRVAEFFVWAGGLITWVLPSNFQEAVNLLLSR